MSRELFYCSEQSRGAGERVFGTASTGDLWLLVEYPFGWGANALEDSNLAPPIKTGLSRMLKSVPRARLLFIKQDAGPRERIVTYVVRTSERAPFAVKMELENYKQVTEIDLAAVAARKLPDGASFVDEPLFLVCTHGRRDKCCAKFGFTLFKELREEQGAFVWQSSHVGGDRFAANVVCFPHGIFYAHMTAEKTRRVITEYGAGRLALDNYRGRACYGHAVQAAEFFVRAETGNADVQGLRFLSRTQAEDGSCRVKFLSPSRKKIYEAIVHSRQSDFSNYITCQSAEQKSVPQFYLSEFRVSDQE